MVDVDHQHRQFLACAQATRDFAVQRFLQVATVERATSAAVRSSVRPDNR
jgi:hypothetical protein